MVNTFLVHSDYRWTAKFLDNRRLGKQRVEAKQIIDAIVAYQTGTTSKGWTNHPASRSWRGHLGSLKLYFNAVVAEWVSRGYNNNYALYTETEVGDPTPPPWTGSSRIHYSMMAQLVQKDSRYYSTENLKPLLPSALYDYFCSLPSEYHQFGYIWPYKYSLVDLQTKELPLLAEPYVARPVCSGCYKDGSACRNKVVVQGRCRLHPDPDAPPVVVAQCSAICRTGHRCRNRAKDGDRCGRH